MNEPLTPEEAVIREWVEAMTSASGSPLPPSQRRAEPLPRRRVLPVIVTLLDIIDGLRASRSPLVIGTDDAPEWLATLDAEQLRRNRGWPTPNHMRRTADALDSLTAARYGDVLRWFADLADAALSGDTHGLRTETYYGDIDGTTCSTCGWGKFAHICPRLSDATAGADR